MIILRIEHSVPDYDGWKEMFDSDPVDRKGSGVRRYTVARATDDPNHVFIDLEFDDAGEAEAMVGKLEEMWSRLDFMRGAQTRLVEVAERTDL